MLKYIKKFQQHSQYLAFTATTEFARPNVSICVQEGDVHYNPYIYPSSITLDPSSLTIRVGDTYTLSATALPSDAGQDVAWASSNDTIAAVDQNGVVSGISAGNVIITVMTRNGLTAQCTVAVVVGVTSVTLNKNTTSLRYGETEQLIATVSPIDAYDKRVTWSSSDENVVTVDGDGNLTTVYDGTAIITVTTVDGGYTAQCTVTVTDSPPFGECLTFTALENGQISYTVRNQGETNTCQYSKNGGAWQTLTGCNSAFSIYDYIAVQAGDVIKLKADWKTTQNFQETGIWSTTCRFTVSGNPMSMLYSNDFLTKRILINAEDGKGGFAKFFSGCTGLTSIEGLVLPATTLVESSYSYMFQGCTSLSGVPSNLLPATTLGPRCYKSMFEGCTSLSGVPSNLLPATTLKSECYARMFYGCTSLTTAPDLLAPTLVDACYVSMFNGCSSLSYIKCLQNNITAAFTTEGWVDRVGGSGDFYYRNGAYWADGVNGIPNGWDRHAL